MCCVGAVSFRIILDFMPDNFIQIVEIQIMLKKQLLQVREGKCLQPLGTSFIIEALAAAYIAFYCQDNGG